MIICDDSSKCSTYNPTSTWTCSSCLKGLMQDFEENLKEPLFTPEQEKMIEEFLDENEKLFDDLVKAGD